MYIYKNTENKNQVADTSCMLLRNAGNYIPLNMKITSQKTCIFSNTGVNVADLKPLTPNDHYSGRTAPLTSKPVMGKLFKEGAKGKEKKL